jgi:hypothetical protein
MKNLLVVMAFLAFTLMHATSYADCTCDDWVEKEGYCVDYVKHKIPLFHIPHDTTEIAAEKNRAIPDVKSGDVAMFKISNYWHVAYVEKVHLDHHGIATAIDVSEMNFGTQLTLAEFQERWGIRSEREWKRALCCGVTENYGLMSSRQNIPLNTVRQVWSPDAAGVGDKKFTAVVSDKVREVINRFFHFAESYL